MKRILVVDDSPTMRRMVIAALRSVPNLDFVEAGSGLEALERLALAPVDLMILDLNMPDMHGFEVLRFVRHHQRFQSTPVIVLTTRSDEDSQTTALSAGASRYRTKPFLPSTLAADAQALLGVQG
jgi:two-component system chemotaxis response regulator CheY